MIRTALLLPIALTLAALLGPAGASDAPAPAIPASSVAPTAPVSAVLPLPQPRPTDVELARRRMAQCRAHPEICEQEKKDERERKEKGGKDAGAPEGNPK